MSVVTKYVPAGRNTSNPAAVRPSREVPLGAQSGAEAVEVRVRQGERLSDRVLEGAGRDVGENCLAERTAVTSSGRRFTQPTSSRLNENVLPAEPMVRVARAHAGERARADVRGVAERQVPRTPRP